MPVNIVMRVSALIAAVNVLVPSLNFRPAHAFLVPNYRFSSLMPVTSATPVRSEGTVPTRLWYVDPPFDTTLDLDVSEMKKEFESKGTTSTEEVDETTARTENGKIRDIGSFKTVLESTREEAFEKIRDNFTSIWVHVSSFGREALRKFVSRGSFSDLFGGEHKLDNHDGSEVSSDSSSSSYSKMNKPRERYENALAEGESMSRSSLKRELKEKGIPTEHFFEKSDLVTAYANAIANGDDEPDESKTYQSERYNKEEFDPSYRKVTMHAFDPRTMLSSGDIVIDIVAMNDHSTSYY